MDADIAITHDHDEIRHLIDRICAMEADAAFLIAQLKMRLAAHAASTETQIYPALTGEDPGCATLTDKHATEHRRLGTSVDSVEDALGTEDFAAAATVLSDRVRAELDSEQDNVLPLLRKLLGPQQLQELGRRFEVRLMAEMDVQTPQPSAPEEPTG